MADLPDYYAVLGVPATASRDEIRAAYRRLARQHHPDTNPPSEDDIVANEQMRQLNAAYAVLNDPWQRAAYDRDRWAQAPPRQPPSWQPEADGPSPAETGFGPQSGGGRWRPPRSRQVVYEQTMPGWLEGFFAVEEHLKKRFRPLFFRLALLVPVVALSALLVFAFWAYNDITNDPNAMGFLTCVIDAWGGVWVLVGVLGVVGLFLLVAWYAIWRAYHS